MSLKTEKLIIHMLVTFLLVFYLISFLVFLSGCPGSGASNPAKVFNDWKDHPEWDVHLRKKVDLHWPDLSLGKDMSKLCPNYDKLDVTLKKKVVSDLFIFVMYFESSWNPLSRYRETTMGTDPVTGRPVYSEGLFQMSYQDEPWAKCGFDWSLDNYLDDTDPKKTILDPFINMSCGVKVMARQVKQKGRFILGKGEGAYWAVILESGKDEKISEISAIIKTNTKECEGI